jgi:glycosyltransferase involved in cell wall biosynthesis
MLRPLAENCPDTISRAPLPSVLAWHGDNPRAYLTVAHLRAEKRGSMEDQLLELARVLRNAGVQADFLFSGWPIWSLQEEFRAIGARIGVLDFARPLSASAALARAIRRRHYAYVHFHFVRAHHPLVLAARSAGARVVLTDHMVLGHLSPRPSARPVSFAKSLARSALSTAVERRIAVSSAVADSLVEHEHVPPTRLHVVRNGIDLKRFQRNRDAGAVMRRQLGLADQPVVICVARFDREKGVDVLVRAAAKSTGPLAKARVLLIGGGLGREATDSLARASGVRDRIVFTGVRSDLEQLYPAADVVVVPSRCPESCSLVTLESQACGVPVVASMVGGIPEHLQHGVGGLLVPADDPDALASAIDTTLANRDLRERLGENGNHFVQQFALDQWVRRLLEVVSVPVTEDSPAKNGQVI